jgi:NADPH:quinone reductase-like Zn-dependent oxidoreductase
VEPDHAWLAELGRLVAGGALRPYVSRTFALRDLAEAHRTVEAGGLQGKVGIEVE